MGFEKIIGSLERTHDVRGSLGRAGREGVEDGLFKAHCKHA